MSEVKTKSHWDRYVGKVVVIQLLGFSNIVITGEELNPIVDEQGGLASTPVLRGTVLSVSECGHLILETTDPNPELPNNRVEIDINADRDIGHVTIVRKNLIAT